MRRRKFGVYNHKSCVTYSYETADAQQRRNATEEPPWSVEKYCTTRTCVCACVLRERVGVGLKQVLLQITFMSVKTLRKLYPSFYVFCYTPSIHFEHYHSEF